MIKTKEKTFGVSLQMSPETLLPSQSWELLPGLWLERITGKLKKEIEKYELKSSSPSLIKPNYLLIMDATRYAEGLKDRIKKEGMPEIKKGTCDTNHVGSYIINLSKMVFISFVLQQNISFATSSEYTFDVTTLNNRKSYKCRSVAYGFTMSYQSFSLDSTIYPERTTPKVNIYQLKSVISYIERYFRPYSKSYDRLSTALFFFWNAITERSKAMMFLNFTIIFECLLSTSKQEISHQISERVAILLGKKVHDRKDIYERVKKNIYDKRSKIVHGDGEPKKGKAITWDSYIISPKFDLMPIKELNDLILYSIELLNIFIKDVDFRSTIQLEKKKEVNNKLNKMFLERLFASE